MTVHRLQRCDNPAAASAWCARVRGDEGGTLGFVATMGALHAGHLELVARSVRENERTCVSVFVNPLQFDDAADLAGYPRDFEGDLERLERTGCDMAFTGTLAAFFPQGSAQPEAIPRRDPGPAAAGLEGGHRAGHFAGVATIVHRLFGLVRPDRAYFGEKDFQQTLVVRHVARAFDGLTVVPCATVRDADGLALSSRNVRLDAAERERARGLSAALFATRRAWRAGERDADRLARTLRRELEARGLRPEYAAVRDPERWTADDPSGALAAARALVAARVGGVRLIDNLALDGHEPEPAPAARG